MTVALFSSYGSIWFRMQVRGLKVELSLSGLADGRLVWAWTSLKVIRQLVGVVSTDYWDWSMMLARTLTVILFVTKVRSLEVAIGLCGRSILMVSLVILLLVRVIKVSI